MKYTLEADCGKLKRIIYTLYSVLDASESQNNLSIQPSIGRLCWILFTDFIGAISLFIMLFGGLWMLPVVSELIR
jgi:hypothetical protein